MLLYVVDSRGSSPGRTGFVMAVTAAGESRGSLGGGIMEHKFVELAKSRLQSGDQQASIHRQLHNKISPVNQSGMICSGEQTIVVYPVGVKDEAALRSIVELYDTFGCASLSISPVELILRPTENLVADFEMTSDEKWLFTGPLGYWNRLFIVGGGHCSLALSQIMSMLDFYIEVVEERTELQTLECNHYAHKINLVEHFGALKAMIPGDEHTYVVVMTMGYRTDKVALRALLSKNYKYLGVLGSAAKIHQMVSELRSEGYAKEDLQRLYAPVGLPIHSQTPAEVAISIAAEIIRIKNTKGP